MRSGYIHFLAGSHAARAYTTPQTILCCSGRNVHTSESARHTERKGGRAPAAVAKKISQADDDMLLYMFVGWSLGLWTALLYVLLVSPFFHWVIDKLAL